MPSADSIADSYLRRTQNLPTSSPSSNPDWFGTFPLLKWANDAGGAAFNLGAQGLGDLTHFAEQDVIKPFETLGKDVYNAGDLVVDAGRSILNLGRTTISLTDKTDKTISNLNDLVTKAKGIFSGQGINVNLGSLGNAAPVDLSGIQNTLSNLLGNTNATTSPSGGTDYTSLLLVGGLIVGAGLVVYMVAKRKK